MQKKNKILLTILDGFGYSKNKHGNAIALAKTPNIDYLIKNYPHTLIKTSGKYVGLPVGQMGNSEVGHLNLGAGRIVYTGLSLINKAITNHEFEKNLAFLKAFSYAKKNKSKLHIIGLVSHGGVHSSYEHIIALLKMCYKNKISPILHVITDGRDVKPTTFIHDCNNFLDECKKYNAKIATISGRYYTMDRDQRWDRIKLAYDTFIGKTTSTFTNLKSYINNSYKNRIFDEFFVPAINGNYNKKDITLTNNDAVIIANFRPDRVRQICHYIYGSNIYNINVENKLKNIFLVTLSKYEGIEPNAIAFPPVKLKNVLGEVLNNNNLSQLRIAETEKYAHVTFFFDGGREINYKKEQKILIPSPKIKTYDLKPEMSANEITKKLLPNIGKFDVIILNYANCDMVGHTGNLQATIKAVEAVDKQIGILYNQCLKNNVTMVILADHGNAELMLDDDNNPITNHTTNPVRMIVTDKNTKILPNGKLANIAPSILKYMNIKIPKEMTEKPIINLTNNGK